MDVAPWFGVVIAAGAISISLFGLLRGMGKEDQRKVDFDYYTAAHTELERRVRSLERWVDMHGANLPK